MSRPHPHGGQLGPPASLLHGLDDEQLRRVVRYVVLVKLAVERGHTNPSRLKPLLTPDAYRQQLEPDISRFLRAPLPAPAEIGAIRMRRLSQDRAMFAVAAREIPQRWGALVVDLRITPDGRLVVAELLRAQDQHLARDRTGPTRDLQERLAELLDERRLVRAALQDALRAEAESPPTPLTARTGPAPAQGWAARLRLLDDTIDGLVGRIDRHGPRPFRVSERFLGPEPTGEVAWERWSNRYRELHDQQGATPAGRSQGAAGPDRQQLLLRMLLAQRWTLRQALNQSPNDSTSARAQELDQRIDRLIATRSQSHPASAPNGAADLLGPEPADGSWAQWRMASLEICERLDPAAPPQPPAPPQPAARPQPGISMGL